MIDIQETLEPLQLPPGEFVVIGGAVLQQLGIRPAYDLDIAVPDETFERLISLPGWQEVRKYGLLPNRVRATYGLIDAGIGWGEWNMDELFDDAMRFEEVAFASLDKIVEWKRQRNRIKDRQDIDLISRYQATEGQH